MDNFKKITETLKINQEISRKFFEIETNILSILNFKDLFERLLTEIQEKIGVPFVWISMIDKSDVSNLIQELAYSETLKERLNLIDKGIFLRLIQNSTKPILINDRLDPLYKLFPQHWKYPIRSLAIAPLTLDGEVIGSLNQGDYSERRFTPGMDTSLLEQLSIKVSICLSNVMAHEQLKWLAYRDPLTGLLNRRIMARGLKREFKRAERYGTSLSLVFLDLDDFKIVNDRYGHDLGDKLLRYVATHLIEMSREIDIVARFAGDEFVIILPNTTFKNARKFVDRLQSFFLKHPINVGVISIPISISSGIATIEDKAITDEASLLKKADQMLYQAKERKKKKKDGVLSPRPRKTKRLFENM
ncbi:MAG: GGDEF domain-containing protein [Deltaproteobacteria bacterium]|nr:GGDEF domain-containing protein [Deltaproteobacteria bacterium]